MEMAMNEFLIKYCTSCGWNHENVELIDQNYFLCPLTKKKVTVTQFTYDGGDFISESKEIISGGEF